MGSRGTVLDRQHARRQPGRAGVFGRPLAPAAALDRGDGCDRSADPGGIGDPVVGGRWRLGAQGGWTAVAEAAVKLPVDGERFLLSTGGVDAGVQLVAQRRSPVWGASVAASVVRTAASRGVLRLPEQTLPSVTTALARRAGSATEAVAQLTWSRSIFHGLSESDLDDDVWSGSPRSACAARAARSGGSSRSEETKLSSIDVESEKALPESWWVGATQRWCTRA